jgi:hypothetical protein
MKKQTVQAFLLLLLIPIVTILGGWVSSLINPEIAAGRPNYARNFHLLNLVKLGSFFAMLAIVGILWLLACYLMIRSKERSPLWLVLAVLGPVGFAILARLNGRVPGEPDRYTQFVRGMNRLVRVGYEVCAFVIIWLVAYEAMVLKRNLMILYESATTGQPTAQIIATQNASSGMWAFGEGIEVMYLVVFLYVLWPIVFNLVARASASLASRKAGEPQTTPRAQL